MIGLNYCKTTFLVLFILLIHTHRFTNGKIQIPKYNFKFFGKLTVLLKRQGLTGFGKIVTASAIEQNNISKQHKHLSNTSKRKQAKQRTK